MKKGHLYVFKGNHGLVKIGVSIDPELRKKTLECSGGISIIDQWISPLCTNYIFVENDLHKIFDKYRSSGEWFNFNFESIVSQAETFEYITKEDISFLSIAPNDKTIVNSDIFLARISPQAKLIYLVICSYGDGCFLSRDNLVTASGYQKNTVMACTKELSENNIISIVKASGKLNQYFTNNPKKWTCDKTSVLQDVI